MDLCSISVIRELLGRHGFGFKKSLGQNFLIERWVPERIVSASGIGPQHGVLEIGPGIGTLTQYLCGSAGKVAAIEIDDRLFPILHETLSDFDNLSLHHADALKADLQEIVRTNLNGLIPAACANLPYYITTPVLEHLFESRLFQQITVMVQKEVAQRICAKPGSAAYGAFTVFSAYYAEPRILFDVPAGCFMPRPNVDSAVVLFEMRKERPFDITDESLFFKIVRASFAQRRKTLVNGLRSVLPLSKEELTELLLSCGFRPDLRGETLSIEAFAKLTEAAAKKLVQFG